MCTDRYMQERTWACGGGGKEADETAEDTSKGNWMPAEWRRGALSCCNDQEWQPRRTSFLQSNRRPSKGDREGNTTSKWWGKRTKQGRHCNLLSTLSSQGLLDYFNLNEHIWACITHQTILISMSIFGRASHLRNSKTYRPQRRWRDTSWSTAMPKLLQQRAVYICVCVRVHACVCAQNNSLGRYMWFYIENV